MLLIRHIRQLITCAGGAPRAGLDQGTLPIIEDGAVAADGERILFAGADRDLPASLTTAPDTRVFDGRGLSVVPGFVDAHTHAVFAGDRREELRRRLGGATYAEIAAHGYRNGMRVSSNSWGAPANRYTVDSQQTRCCSQARTIDSRRFRCKPRSACHSSLNHGVKR